MKEEYTFPFVVTGIGTGVGKTLVSAILLKALDAGYWKPLQTGFQQGGGDSDTYWIEEILNQPIYPEAYCFNEPLSPHAAAIMDGLRVELSQIVEVPPHEGYLVIEGAGGLMVPMNFDMTLLDLFGIWKFPVILVVSHYLGNINHTLMSIEMLKERNIPLAGLIFNGQALPYTEEVIEYQTGAKVLLRIPPEAEINLEFIEEMAQKVDVAALKKYYE